MINYEKLKQKLMKEGVDLSSIVSKDIANHIMHNGNIRLTTLEKICKALKCQPNELVSFTR